MEHPAEIRAMGREARSETEANSTARNYAEFWRDRVIEPLLSENIPGWGASATGRLDRMIYSGHSALDQRWRRLRTAWLTLFIWTAIPILSA